MFPNKPNLLEPLSDNHSLDDNSSRIDLLMQNIDNSNKDDAIMACVQTANLDSLCGQKSTGLCIKQRTSTVYEISTSKFNSKATHPNLNRTEASTPKAKSKVFTPIAGYPTHVHPTLVTPFNNIVVKKKKISGGTDWGDFNEHATNLFPYHISKPVFNKKLSGNSNESPIDLSIDIDENKETITLKDSVPNCTKSVPRTDSIDVCIDVGKQNDESSVKDSEALSTKLIRPPGMSNVSWCWYQADMNRSCRTPSPDNGRDILMEELGKRDHMNDVELKDFRLKYAKTESKLPQKEIDYLRIERKKYDDSDSRRYAKLCSTQVLTNLTSKKPSSNVTPEVINDCISLESTTLSHKKILK